MEYQEITNKKTGEKLQLFSESDIVKADPIRYYRDSFVVQNMILDGVPMDELQGRTKVTLMGKFKFMYFTKMWNSLYKGITAVELPENLKLLFATTKKSDQEKLLKGVSITPDILAATIFYANQKYGYLFSQYSTETPQKGLDTSKLPFAYQVDGDKVNVYGKTDLSDGQLKQALEHRKVVIAKFLEKGDNDWHCFFTTFKSLRGEETWEGQGQPHFHYLSNYFGLAKDKVISELKSPRYRLGNLPHIKLEDYGTQPQAKTS